MLNELFPEKTRRILQSLVFSIIAAFAVAAFAADAKAATFVVNTTADTQDAAPGNGTCADSTGMCSLRAAITEANALAGADIITLPAGTYTQTLVAAEENANAGGDFDITSPITINRAGAATTIVPSNAAPNTATERVFHVLSPGATSVTMNCMTIQNGVATIVGSEVGRGGGLRAGNNVTTDSSINLTVTNSKFLNNYAGTRGGGLAINKGILTVTGCTFDGNHAGFGTQSVAAQSGGAGGAILIDSQDNIAVSGQTSTITNTVMSNNVATSNFNNTFGGALIIRAVDSLVTITGCTVNNNQSTWTGSTTNCPGSGGTTPCQGFAGGLYNQQAHMVVNNTVVDANTSTSQTGIRNLASTQTAATLEITDSTISNNAASGTFGGGISNVVGGNFDGTVSIDHSTISGNSVAGDSGAGGGLINSADAVSGQGSTSITNSTFSGNNASFGGGLYTDGSVATVVIDYSTFAANSAHADGEGGSVLQDATAGGATFISTSIFADNTSPIAGTEDLDGTAANYTSLGYNHVESGIAFTTTTGDVTSRSSVP